MSGTFRAETDLGQNLAVVAFEEGTLVLKINNEPVQTSITPKKVKKARAPSGRTDARRRPLLAGGRPVSVRVVVLLAAVLLAVLGLVLGWLWMVAFGAGFLGGYSVVRLLADDDRAERD